MPWSAIQYATSGLTLAAFLAAIVLALYRRRLKSRERLIASVPKNDRASLVQATLERFDIDTSRLTNHQAYDLVLEQIRARSRRYAINAGLIGLFGLFTFIVFLVDTSVALPQRITSVSTPPANTDGDKAMPPSKPSSDMSKPTMDLEKDTGNIPAIRSHPSSSKRVKIEGPKITPSFFAGLSGATPRHQVLLYEGSENDIELDSHGSRGLGQCQDSILSCAPSHPRYLYFRYCIEFSSEEHGASGSFRTKAAWFDGVNGSSKVADTTVVQAPVSGGECFFSALGGQNLWHKGYYEVDLEVEGLNAKNYEASSGVIIP